MKLLSKFISRIRSMFEENKSEVKRKMKEICNNLAIIMKMLGKFTRKLVKWSLVLIVVGHFCPEVRDNMPVLSELSQMVLQFYDWLFKIIIVIIKSNSTGVWGTLGEDVRYGVEVFINFINTVS